jgi:hypothetical protein
MDACAVTERLRGSEASTQLPALKQEELASERLYCKPYPSFALLTASISGGTISNKSPTIP